jgi:hypothetical protein
MRLDRRTDRYNAVNSRFSQFLRKASKTGTLDEDFGRTPVELNVWKHILNDVPARFQIAGKRETNKNLCFFNRLNYSAILIKSLPYNESGARQPFFRRTQFFNFLSLSPICV